MGSPAQPVAAMIRENIREQVESSQWLDRLRQEYDQLREKQQSDEHKSERCMVCTLPLGTCEHSAEWLGSVADSRDSALLEAQTVSNVDQEIDDVLGLLGDSAPVTSAPVEGDIDLGSMAWTRLEQRLSDKIGAESKSLFAPDERGWHSCVALGDQVIVVFGGFKYRAQGQNVIPQPFHAIPSAQEVEYLSDVLIYDIDNLSWHGVKAKGAPVASKVDIAEANERLRTPDGRYGHVAAPLDGNRMLLFGGRGDRGKIFNDTWIYHYEEQTWRSSVNPDILAQIGTKGMYTYGNGGASIGSGIDDYSAPYVLSQTEHRDLVRGPSPSPRYFSSCVVASGQGASSNDVYLFGGTDGIDNFGDLWVFRGDPLVMKWERLVAVGLPPSPRYGHQLVTAGEGRLAVVGGCVVSPQGEVIGSNMSISETNFLLEASSKLQKRYQSEGNMAGLGGEALQSTILDSKTGLSDIYRQAASISSSIYRLEQETRKYESDIVQQWNLSKATRAYQVQKARHTNPFLDVHFYDVNETMWKEQLYPPVRGDIPRSRIHFGATQIGNYIFLMGGIEPTSLKYKLVEVDDSQVYALDLASMRWQQLSPVNSVANLQIPLQIADADIIRANRRCAEEKARGLSLGALNGKTIELAEAEAVLAVCKWRKDVLLKEQSEFLSSTSPPPRFAAALTRTGQRLLYSGGWYVHGAVPKGDLMVLNLEHELEKRRRQNDEYVARMERQRISEEAQANIANVQSIHELRAKILAEKENEERERDLMSFEEILSSLPPLSKPNPVQLVKANQHTIWVKWDRITQNADRAPIDPENITYMLYMKSSFENLLVGDRVSVSVELPPSTGTKNKSKVLRGSGDYGSVSSASQFDYSLLAESSVAATLNSFNANYEVHSYCGKFFDDTLKRYGGEITRIRPKGCFDILFDDGTTEKDVHRSRIRKEIPALDTQASQSNINSNFSSSPLHTGSDASASVSAEDSQSIATMSNITINTSQLSATMQRHINKKRRQRERALKKVSELRKAIAISSVENRRKYGDSSTVSGCGVAISPITSRAGSEHGQNSNRNSMAGGMRRGISTQDNRNTSSSHFLSGVESMFGIDNTKNQLHPSRRGPTLHNGSKNGLDLAPAATSDAARLGIAAFRSNRSMNSSNVSLLSDGVSEDPDIFQDSIAGESANIERIEENSKGNSKLSCIGKSSRTLFTENCDDSTIPKVTVTVPPDWKLVYIGNDNEYTCSGVVASDAIAREPDLSIPVAFRLQTHGADFPDHERSQLSQPAIFYTRVLQSSDSMPGEDESSLVYSLSTGEFTDVGSADEHSVVSQQTFNVNSIGDIQGSGSISKTKKSIISAVINGQTMVKIKRNKDTFTSEGQAEDYL